jgi:hypothetical protein
MAFAVAHTIQIDAGEEISTEIHSKLFPTRKAAKAYIAEAHREWYAELEMNMYDYKLAWQGDTAQDTNTDIVSFWQIDEVAI